MAVLSSQQKRTLRKLQARQPLCVPDLRKPECFVLNFISFEAQARKVWHYYRCRKTAQSESRAGIPLAELKKAISHFKIQFGDDKLDLLLDSKLGTRKHKSARNLRNGIVHQWLEGDCKEAENRYNEFMLLFKEFDTALKRVL